MNLKNVGTGTLFALCLSHSAFAYNDTGVCHDPLTRPDIYSQVVRGFNEATIANPEQMRALQIIVGSKPDEKDFRMLSGRCLVEQDKCETIGTHLYSVKDPTSNIPDTVAFLAVPTAKGWPASSMDNVGIWRQFFEKVSAKYKADIKGNLSAVMTPNGYTTFFHRPDNTVNATNVRLGKDGTTVFAKVTGKQKEFGDTVFYCYFSKSFSN